MGHNVHATVVTRGISEMFPCLSKSNSVKLAVMSHSQIHIHYKVLFKVLLRVIYFQERIGERKLEHVNPTLSITLEK